MASEYEVPALFSAAGARRRSVQVPDSEPVSEVELESPSVTDSDDARDGEVGAEAAPAVGEEPSAEEKPPVEEGPAAEPASTAEPEAEPEEESIVEAEPAPEPAVDAPASPSNHVDVSPSMRFMSQLADDDLDIAQVDAALSDFPSFRRTDAEGSLEAVNGVPAVLAEERRALRRRGGIAIAAIVVLALLSFRVLDSVGATFATALCGAVVCVGGLLFQSAFGKRHAVAPVVGVSAAVLVGQGIALVATGATLGCSWLALVIACVLGMAPVVALRFRLNVLLLGDDDARQFGVDANRLRTLAMACGVVLLVIAQVCVGPVFALALVVSLVARNLFGAEFRKTLAGTALLGAAALLFACLIPLPLWISATLVAAALFAYECHIGLAEKPLG